MAGLLHDYILISYLLGEPPEVKVAFEAYPVSVMYHYGINCAPDWAKAREYIEMAAAAGYEPAIEAVRRGGYSDFEHRAIMDMILEFSEI